MSDLRDSQIEHVSWCGRHNMPAYPQGRVTVEHSKTRENSALHRLIVRIVLRTRTSESSIQ